jgi:hypothetical protein
MTTTKKSDETKALSRANLSTVVASWARPTTFSAREAVL